MEILVLLVIIALLGVFLARGTARVIRVLDALYAEMRATLDGPTGPNREGETRETPWSRPPRPLFLG